MKNRKLMGWKSLRGRTKISTGQTLISAGAGAAWLNQKKGGRDNKASSRTVGGQKTGRAISVTLVWNDESGRLRVETEEKPLSRKLTPVRSNTSPREKQKTHNRSSAANREKGKRINCLRRRNIQTRPVQGNLAVQRYVRHLVVPEKGGDSEQRDIPRGSPSKGNRKSRGTGEGKKSN